MKLAVRIATICVLGAGILGCSSSTDSTSGSRQAGSAPDVLLITLDTTRADRMGCYGYPKPTTPRMDAFSLRGHRFDMAIAQASVTPVSHASIFTGLNPYRHGLRVLHGTQGHRLPDATETLAERLASEGYATGAFVSAFPVTEYFGLHQGFDLFEASFMSQSADSLVSAAGTVSTGVNQRGADETTELALEWIDRQSGPYFAWVHYFDPHDTALLPPGVDLAEYEGMKLPVALSEIYDVEMRFMDEQVGRLLERLDAAGRLEHTVVVIVSDHGEGLGDHGWWTHGLLYQEQLRVPLIIVAPDIAPAVSGDLVRTIDIVPTVYRLAGLSIPASLDGRDLTPQMQGESLPPVQAYADSLSTGLTYDVNGVTEAKDDIHWALIDMPWKYIHHGQRPQESELFDLAQDPGERTNVLRERQDVGLHLFRALSTSAMSAPVGEETELSDEARERLRSLGYVN